MKTLKDLTPEIKAKIPEYIEKAKKGIFDGELYKNFDKEKAKNCVNWNYNFCGYNSPIVLVAENPYEAQIYYNLIKQDENLLKVINLIYYLKTNQTSELRTKLDSKLHSELYSKLDSKLKSELDSKLDSKLNSELYFELDSELDSKLDSELYTELISKLASELRTKLNSELNSKLNSELNSKLNFELDSKLSSELDSKLNFELDSKLSSELDSKLNFKLDSKLSSELDSKLTFTYISDYLFTINMYSNAIYTWYEFARKEFNLQLSIDETFQECFKLQRESGIYSGIFTDKVVIVSKYPKKINRNGIILHSLDESAVVWGHSNKSTKWDCCYVNGRNIDSELFQKCLNKSLTFEEFTTLDNEDTKAGIITLIREKHGHDYFLKWFNIELLDSKTFNHSSSHVETQHLYRTKTKVDFLADENGEKGEYMSFYHIKCPSTESDYLLDTKPEFTTVDECAKFHRPSLIPENLKYDFTQFNN